MSTEEGGEEGSSQIGVRADKPDKVRTTCLRMCGGICWSRFCRPSLSRPGTIGRVGISPGAGAAVGAPEAGLVVVAGAIDGRQGNIKWGVFERFG
jgi:hypothetical protein